MDAKWAAEAMQAELMRVHAELDRLREENAALRTERQRLMADNNALRKSWLKAIDEWGAEVAALRTDAEAFAWLAERLEDVQIDDVDPTMCMDEGDSWVDAWRKALAARGGEWCAT